jgi:hypothetical protein
MTLRILGIAAIAASTVLASAHVTAQAPAARTTRASSWTPPRTIDGQPDISGVYSNATYTPLERPAEFKDREFFTPEEAAAFAKRRLADLEDQPADDVHYDDALWQSEKTPRGVTSLRTSIIIEPKNGRLPPMNEEGQKRQAARAAARKGIGQFDSAQARSLSERCIIWTHEGPPILPTGYNSHIQIMQGPGHVVVMHEMMRDPRIIPLDGSPHPGPEIQKLRGDSRGRWEGNTLVVETTNFTDTTAFRGASPSQRVIERFTPVDPETVLYEFTVDDPKTWSVPWKGEVPLRKTDDKLYEYACHEGNYGIRNILNAQRVAEAEAAAGRK